MTIGPHALESRVAEAHDRSVAVGREIDLDARGARRQRVPLAFPAPREDDAARRADLDELAAGNVART